MVLCVSESKIKIFIIFLDIETELNVTSILHSVSASFYQSYRGFAGGSISVYFYSYSKYINVIKSITLLPSSFYALLNLFLFLC